MANPSQCRIRLATKSQGSAPRKSGRFAVGEILGSKETDMQLTKDLRDTINARTEHDPEVGSGLICEAIEAMLSKDFENGRVLLRDLV